MKVDPVVLVAILAAVCAEPGVWAVAGRDCDQETLKEYREKVTRLQGGGRVPSSRFPVPR